MRVYIVGMARRGGSAHVATIKTKGKDGALYTSHLLRRSYREGGKVRHGNLGNLSHLPVEIIDVIRAMLAGTEVKALRDGRTQLREGYVRVEGGEAWLLGVNIAEYTQGHRLHPFSPKKRNATPAAVLDSLEVPVGKAS